MVPLMIGEGPVSPDESRKEFLNRFDRVEGEQEPE